MTKKLIIPAEIKVCATCSFWDGDRKIDTEVGVVVVDENCAGECLVQCTCRQGLTDEFEWHEDCLWEHLAPDSELAEKAQNAEDTTKPTTEK